MPPFHGQLNDPIDVDVLFWMSSLFIVIVNMPHGQKKEKKNPHRSYVLLAILYAKNTSKLGSCSHNMVQHSTIQVHFSSSVVFFFFFSNL